MGLSPVWLVFWKFTWNFARPRKNYNYIDMTEILDNLFFLIIDKHYQPFWIGVVMDKLKNKSHMLSLIHETL